MRHSHKISIHALLAESDHRFALCGCLPRYFYPRSPCGERLANLRGLYSEAIFLSTLSLRRATTIFAVRPYDAPIFLSTLSLRRATTEIWDVIAVITISIHALLAESDSRHTTTTHNDTNFYPRSPCGERRHVNAANFHLLGISIHALLAESDPFSRSGPMMRRYFYPRSPCGERREYWVGGYGTANNFYPRSPCGERLSSDL